MSPDATWSTYPFDDKAKAFAMTFQLRREDEDGPIATARIFFEEALEDVYEPAPVVPGRRTPLDHIFVTGDRLSGHLEWLNRPASDATDRIFANLWIDDPKLERDWHYEGFVAAFPGPVPPPPVPHPDGPSPLPVPPEAAGLGVAATDLATAELFPFVALEPWPALPQPVEDTAFIALTPDQEHASAFLTQLAAAGSPDDARQDAVTYVEGAAFVQRPEDLPPPFNRYLAVWRALAVLDRPDLAELTAIVEAEFGGWDDWQTARSGADPGPIWDSLVALNVLAGYRHGLLGNLIRIVTVDHLLQHAAPPAAPPPEGIAQLRAATVVLPDDIFPLGDAEPATPERVAPYAVGAARSIRYAPLGYDLGDVQRIENVLRGERRERRSRQLSRSETRDRQTDRAADDGTRTADVTASDLITQVQKTLSDRVTTTNINAYDTSYDMPSANAVGVTGNWWVQEQPGGGYVQDDARFARDVVDRAVRRIARTVHRDRARTELSETERSDLLAFDNTGGAEDIRGVYRWVNRTYRLIERTLGDKLILEILLDRPGAHLVTAIRRDWTLDLIAPAPPPIHSYADISDVPGEGYYLDLFQRFDVAEPLPPPPATRRVGASLKTRSPLAEAQVSIPPGYAPASAAAQVATVGTPATVEVVVGTTKLTSGDGGYTADLTGIDADAADALWVALFASPPTQQPAGANGHALVEAGADPAPPAAPPLDTEEFATLALATVDIACRRRSETLADWQYRAWTLIQAGYARQREAYLDQVRRQIAALEAENPAFLTQAVDNQIAQACTAAIYRHHLARAGLTPPEDAEAPAVFQYIRGALEWPDLTAQLYLEAGEDPMAEGQAALLQEVAPDQRFRNLLRARRARILVPVDRAVARSVLYFLATGLIWPEADALAPCLPGDLRAVIRLKAGPADPPEGGRSWVVRVPTAMTILSPDPSLPS